MSEEDGATVLVVDDEEDVADAYAAQLRSRYDVRTVYRGEAALEALSDEVDVVLLDRRMPDLSGDDVLAEIRDRDLETRVAMVTAIDPDFEIIDMPFDDYVVKPVDREDLEETIERLLACTAYENHVREFYSLSAKYAALESTKTTAELEDSEEFQELQAELEEHRDALDEITESFDEDGFEIVLGDFDRPDEVPSGS